MGAKGNAERVGEMTPVLADPTSGAEAVARSFGQALLAGDADAAGSYFAPDAHILTPDGTAIAGREHVIAMLRQITASDQELEIRVGRTLVAGAVAMATQFWRRSTPEAASPSYASSSVARLVLARSEERWEIAIASPWE